MLPNFPFHSTLLALSLPPTTIPSLTLGLFAGRISSPPSSSPNDSWLSWLFWLILISPSPISNLLLLDLTVSVSLSEW